MALSEEERFRRCGELFALAKTFAWMRAPDTLSPGDKRKFVFKELYGFELPENPDLKVVKNDWLSIVYSGFWDYPFAFVVTYNESTYLFLRGGFDEELDDYPSEYEVILRNDIDVSTIEENFTIDEGGEFICKIDMKQIKFDPTHREQIHSEVFKQIYNE